MKKRKSLVVLALLLVTAIFSTSVFAAGSFTDVTDNTPYKNAIITLTKLGVINGYEDGTFRPDHTITRAEFTAIITRVLGADEVQIEPTEFTDIADHWARYNIKTAYDRGIINGMGDGTFQPEQSVTYEQALKMVVCTLGYGTSAEASGGWPTGYLQQADALKLTKTVSGVKSTEPAPRGVIAQVVYNALEIKMQEQNGASWETTEKTLMKDYLKIEKIKGIVTGIEDSVTEENTVKLLQGQMGVLVDGDEIVLDFSSYTEDASTLKQYLGNTITAYYRLSIKDDEAVLLVIDDETVKNTETFVNYDDIYSFDGQTFKYYDQDDKIKSIKFDSENISIIYNGKIVKKTDDVNIDGKGYAATDALQMWLDPENENFIYGDVKITDSGADGMANLIVVNDYEVIVANKVPSVSDYRISDKLKTGNYLILDPNSVEYTCSIIKDGKEIPITSIKTGDVVLYAKSLDGSMYTAYVTSKTVAGTITSVSNDGLVTINGTQYRVNQTCYDYLAGKGEIKAGASVTFYVDKMDNVVYGTIAAEQKLPYGFIVNSSYDETDELGYMSVFLPPSTVKSMKTRDKVKLNGASYSYEALAGHLRESALRNNQDAEMAGKIYGSGQEVTVTDYSQIAKIGTSNNEVTSVITLDEEEGVINEDSDRLVRYKSLGNYKYTKTNDFNSEFYINSSTTILYIPQDRNDKTKYAKRISSSAFTVGDSYWVEAYDVNSSKYASLVLLYGKGGSETSVGRTTPYSVVAEAPLRYDDDGEIINRLELYSSKNKLTEQDTADDVEFSDVEVGDVIQFGLDTSNRATDRQNILKFSDIRSVLDSNIYDWNDSKFEHFYRNDDGEIEYYNKTNLVPYSRVFMANVLEVNTEDNTIRVTRNAIDENGQQIGEEKEERFTIRSTSTSFIRMESNYKSFSTTAEGTSEAISIEDLKGAVDYGNDCSKIMIYTQSGNVPFIVIYK